MLSSPRLLRPRGWVSKMIRPLPCPFPSSDSAAVTLFSPNLEKPKEDPISVFPLVFLALQRLKQVDLLLQHWLLSSTLRKKLFSISLVKIFHYSSLQFLVNHAPAAPHPPRII